MDFFDATSLVRRSRDGSTPSVLFSRAAPLVPGRGASRRSRCGRQRFIAAIGHCRRPRWPVDAAVAELLGLPAEVPAYVAEVAIEPLARLPALCDCKATAPPRFPSVDRDISILVDETTRRRNPFARPSASARHSTTSAGLREFDRYAGKGHP